MDIEVLLYKKFREKVIAEMLPGQTVNRAQIIKRLNITSLLADKLLIYIKRQVCKGVYGQDECVPTDGYAIIYKQCKKIRKMYFIKL